MQKVSTLPFFKRGHSNEVVIKPITVAKFNNLPHVSVESLTAKQHFEQRKQMIADCTDISEDEFNTFMAPDFNTLSADISDFILKPSDEFDEWEEQESPYLFKLLFPFENELGEVIHTVSFSVPTVAHSKALSEISDNREREDFMFRVVTGLEKADVECMALNDYLLIKPKVGAFFMKSGAFFTQMTLKA